VRRSLRRMSPVMTNTSDDAVFVSTPKGWAMPPWSAMALSSRPSRCLHCCVGCALLVRRWSTR
jgi:hypothetical protein